MSRYLATIIIILPISKYNGAVKCWDASIWSPLRAITAVRKIISGASSSMQEYVLPAVNWSWTAIHKFNTISTQVTSNIRVSMVDLSLMPVSWLAITLQMLFLAQSLCYDLCIHDENKCIIEKLLYTSHKKINVAHKNNLIQNKLKLQKMVSISLPSVGTIKTQNEKLAYCEE